MMMTIWGFLVSRTEKRRRKRVGNSEGGQTKMRQGKVKCWGNTYLYASLI